MVRSPYTRVLSVFLEKLNKPYYKRVFFSKMNQPIREIEFLEFLQILYRCRQGDPLTWNYHWRPVRYYFNHPSDLGELDFIGHLENFDKDIHVIIDLIAKKAKLKISDKDKKKYIIRTFAPHAQQAHAKLNRYYNQEAIRLVQEIYREDFQMLGYSTDFNKAMEFPTEKKYRYPQYYHKPGAGLYQQFLNSVKAQNRYYGEDRIPSSDKESSEKITPIQDR